MEPLGPVTSTAALWLVIRLAFSALQHLAPSEPRHDTSEPGTAQPNGAITSPGGCSPEPDLVEPVPLPSAEPCHLPVCVVVDNGSLKAESVLGLRQTAKLLEDVLVSEHLACLVVPTSLRYSDRIDPAELENQPAETLVSCMQRLISDGHTSFVVVPAFLGESTQITELLPKMLSNLELVEQTADQDGNDSFSSTAPQVTVHVASCLVDVDGEGSDDTVACALADRIREATEHFASQLSPSTPVVVVDHGSPSQRVTEARNVLVRQLMRDETVGSRIIVGASMERRPGEKYSFNEPLLENVLNAHPELLAVDNGRVLIALAFLSPGKHAGAGGDIDCILQDMQAKVPSFQPFRCRLLGTHPLIISQMANRFRQALFSPALEL